MAAGSHLPQSASRASRLELEPNPFEVSFQSPRSKPQPHPPNTAASASPPNSGSDTADEPPAEDPKPSGTGGDFSQSVRSGGHKPKSAHAQGPRPSSQEAHSQQAHPQQPQHRHSQSTPARPHSLGSQEPGSAASGSASSPDSAQSSGQTASSGPSGSVSKSLPGITALTSPSDGNNLFNWVSSSLRDGPLSPAMLGAPSTSSQGFDVSAFRTGLTPDLANFKTGLTPLGSGMSMPPASPNTAAFLAMVSSNGANNVPSGTVNASTGMLSISAAPHQSAPQATLTPNTLNALTNTGQNHNNGDSSTPHNNNHHSNQTGNPGSTDNFSRRGSLERPGSRLRTSVFPGPEDAGEEDKYSPSNTSQDAEDNKASISRLSNPRLYRPDAGSGDSPTHPSAGNVKTGNGPRGSGDHPAASGLYLLSQAHHELSKREGNAAAAQAAAQALQGIPRAPAHPDQPPAPKRAGSGASARSGSKRKKQSPTQSTVPLPTVASNADQEKVDAPARPKGRGKAKSSSGSKKTRTDSKRSLASGGSTSSSFGKAYDDVDDGNGDPDLDQDQDLELDDGSEGSHGDPRGGRASLSGPNASASHATGNTDEEKRKSFLERNRQAALKCRQRKKAWLQSLQQSVEVLRRENDSLTSTVDLLQQEVVYLRTQLFQSTNGTHPAVAAAAAAASNGANAGSRDSNAASYSTQTSPQQTQSQHSAPHLGSSAPGGGGAPGAPGGTQHYLASHAGHAHPHALGRDMFPPHTRGTLHHPHASYSGYGGMPPPPPPGGFGQNIGLDSKKIDVQ